jgi:hypothetical protein
MPMTCAPRVLLLESDPAVRSALIFSLELGGFIVEAVDPSTPLPAGSPGDCLVVDHDPRTADAMAVMSTSCVPVVVLATNPGRSLRERIRQAGATLIEKPLLDDTLSKVLRSVYRQSPSALSN